MWGAGKGLRGGLVEAGGGGAGWREQLGLQGKPGQGRRRVGTRKAAGASAATRPRRRPQRGGRGRTVSGVEAAVWWGRAVDCLWAGSAGWDPGSVAGRGLPFRIVCARVRPKGLATLALGPRSQRPAQPLATRATRPCRSSRPRPPLRLLSLPSLGS